jgi:Histidine kinase
LAEANSLTEMKTMTDSPSSGRRTAIAIGIRFMRWVRMHPGAVGIAGLLSFAAPVTFFAGAVSVMRDPTIMDVVVLAAWFVLFGAELWVSLLVVGYLLQHVEMVRRYPRTATLLGAAAAAALAEFSNGRGEILVEQGVAQDIETMHLFALVFAVTMALLFFAHLRLSRRQEEAAARLGAAQSAQHEARWRLAQARLQAVQARIDPQLLFEMLDAVRRAYENDPSRAERLLDELATFLRAALPRLRSSSSTVLREAQLAHAYARLRTLAGAGDVDMTLEVSPDVADARFPPGVLLPLLDDALRVRTGSCDLTVGRSSGDCRLVLTLPASPLDAAVARVRSLLTDLYGTAAELAVGYANGVASATVKVPFELA